MDVHDLVKHRVEFGRATYGHGLLHHDNENMDFKKELVEELLDAVIYAGADVVKNTPQVTAKFHTEDDGSVRLHLHVNYEMDDDGNSAVLDRIKYESTKEYDFKHRDKYVSAMNICMFALEAVLKL